MNKETAKNYLIISFVVVELLSMIFNFYFVKLEIAGSQYQFNFSIIFFCIGFFIVDIVADNYSPDEANKFIFYKLFCQLLFLLLGNIAINVYSLEETQLAKILNKSAWMIMSGFLSTYVGFKSMSYLMSYLKIRTYQGRSVFRRYLYSTIPGELIFSLLFTSLCFFKYSSFDELIRMFMVSAFVKIVMSFIFASLISFFALLRYGMVRRLNMNHSNEQKNAPPKAPQETPH